MKKILSIIVAIALSGFLVYVISFQKKEIPAEKPGKVTATSAYEKYFGAAPAVDKGTAFAFVIYFPSSKYPGKVVPFPFFTFDEASIKKVAVERLLIGMDTGSYRGEFIPFASGISLVSLNDAQGTVTVNFSKEPGKTADSAIAAALVLTLRQFNGVKDVRLQAGGKESLLNPSVKNVNDNAVQPLPPPRLLNVTGMRDKGAKDIEEVDVFFDRPVDIKELRLLQQDGQQFAGDLYHSVFDMAGVLKPKTPSQFKEQMPVKVRWKVADKLGRKAEGETILPLEVKEH